MDGDADHVSPVFAAYPAATPLADRDDVWGGRWYLLTHAAQLASDPRAQEVVRKWHVAYVYVSSDMIKPFRQKLVASELRRSPVYRQVWQRGDVAIFKIDLSPSVAGG